MTDVQGWWLWQISIGRERGPQHGAMQIISEACERQGWARWTTERGWSITPKGQAALADAYIMDSDDPVEHARILIRGPLKRDTREHLQPPLIR